MNVSPEAARANPQGGRRSLNRNHSALSARTSTRTANSRVGERCLRCTTSAAGGNGLGTTIRYLRRTTSGSAGNGLGTTIKYLRRKTSGAAGNGLGATIKYLRRTMSGAGGIGLSRYRGLLMCLASSNSGDQHLCEIITLYRPPPHQDWGRARTAL
jgi:hypothetical protein